MILISDFCLTARNRGTAALGYGAISFLREKGYLNSSDVIVLLELTRNPLKKSFYTQNIVQGKEVTFYHLFVTSIEYRLLMAFGLIIPFSRFGKFCKNLKFVASINGGDGFSDIYGDTLFKSRLPYTHLAMKLSVPHILLPQTIGPFEKKCNKEEAHNIIKYSEAIFVRDKKYVKELDDLGVKYELTKDLFDNDLGEKHDEMALRIWNYFKKKSVELVNIGCTVILDWGFWTLESRRNLTEFYHSQNVRILS